MGQFHVFQCDGVPLLHIPEQGRAVQQIEWRQMPNRTALKKLRNQAVYGMMVSLHLKFSAFWQIPVSHSGQDRYLTALRVRAASP